MKTWPIAVVVCLCLALAGCRTDPNVALVERQNRLLEDENYRLRGMIQDFEEGGSANCVEDRAASSGETRRNGEGSYSSRDPSRPKEPFQVETGDAASGIPDTMLPKGEKRKTAPRESAPGNPPTENAPLFPGGPTLMPPRGDPYRSGAIQPTAGYEPVVQADSREVNQVVLNRMLTGGYSAGGKSGDDGVLVVLEPRDAQGRRLEAPGDVVVVLVDPTIKDEKASRVARWDFAAGETAKLFRGTGVGQGMYIECPWPDRQPPERRQLLLNVRYVTRDGRKLEILNQPIDFALPGEKSTRWTANESKRSAAEPSGPEIVSDRAGREPADSAEGEYQPRRAVSSPETASRDNGPRIQKPVWTPERY